MSSVAIDSAFWKDLETRVRALLGGIRIVGMVTAGGWTLTCDGSGDTRANKRHKQLFASLATRAAIAAGISNGANALDAWLNLLRTESPHFHAIDIGSYDAEGHVTSDGGWIQDLVLATAEQCVVQATRAFEIEMAAAATDLQPNEAESAMDPTSATYDPTWNLRGGGSDPETARESFRRLARRATTAIPKEFAVPSQAVDYWIDLLHDYHSQQTSKRYTAEPWRLRHVSEASAEYCAEQSIRAHEAKDSKAEEKWAKLEHQFRQILSPQGDLSAARRRERHARPDPPVESTASDAKGRKRGPRPDHESASRVAAIVMHVAPDGDWRPRLDDVCEALDDAEIPRPKPWRSRNPPSLSWSTCADQDRAICIQAIEYRLKSAKRKQKRDSKTSS